MIVNLETVRKGTTVIFSRDFVGAREFLYLSYVGQSVAEPDDTTIGRGQQVLDSLDKLIDSHDKTDGEASEPLKDWSANKPFIRSGRIISPRPVSPGLFLDNLKAAVSLEPDLNFLPLQAVR